MIVCSCNRLSDREIAGCCAQSPTVASAYRALGCKPKCGRCASTINQILQDARADVCDRGCIPGRCECLEAAAEQAGAQEAA